MVQRWWSPPPVQLWSVDLTPRPSLWWWKGAFLLITILTYLLSYLVSYLLAVTPRPPCGGGRVLTYLVTCLTT